MLTAAAPHPALVDAGLCAAVVAPMLVVAALATSRPRLRAATAAAWWGAAAALGGGIALVAVGALAPLRATLFVFGAALAAVAVSFSRRHLDGDPRAGRYRRRLLVAAAAAVTTLGTSDAAALAVAWVAAGWAVVGLVGHHDDLSASGQARSALRRAGRIADAGLLVALSTLVVGAGTTSLAGIGAWAGRAPVPLLAVAGVGLLVAVAARSAQWPFCRWLPLSVVAPAPASALLHAGIANAPVVVLLALAPVWQRIGWFAPALLAVGLGTAVLTFVRLLVRADVKTRLAWSTTAQLGFMLALVAVGAHAAAVLHLMLHGLYKATAFLRAGQDISAARQDRPLRAGRPARLVGAGAGLVIGLVLLALDGGWHQPLTAAAFAVAATAAGYGLGTWTARPRVRVAAAGLAVLAAASTLVLARGAAEFWQLPVEAAGADAWVAAALVLGLAVIGAVLRGRQPVRGWAVLHRAADPALGLPGAIALRRAAPARPTGADAAPSSQQTADQVRRLVGAAAEALPPTWGWQGFVAANPLWGNRFSSFAEALAGALADRPGVAADPAQPARGRTETAVDDAVAGWLAAWTAPAGAPWPAPRRDLPLWTWFRTVAVHDPLLILAAPRGQRPAELPAAAADLVAQALAEAATLGWSSARGWLDDELARLPGWAGYLARRSTVAAAVDVDAVVDLLAVRVATRRALTGALVPAAPVAPAGATRGPAGRAAEVLAELVAAESAGRDRLARVLAPAAARVAAADDAPVARPEADLVLCIDVRSERLRRHLEALGPYRTIGFAGFFGLPLQRRAGDAAVTSRLPALVAPAVQITAPAVQASVADLLTAALRQALDAPGGGFAAVDVAGLRAVTAAAGVIRPRRRTPRALPAPTVVDADREAALRAAVALARATGIGPSSAPLVVLVGHGSTSTNNTAEAAFDCGACGGYRGGDNAAVAADLLNSAAGRQALAAAGIPLPADTVVLAAEHDTALDVVLPTAPDTVPGPHRARFDRLAAALQQAGAQVAVERCRYLGDNLGDNDPATGPTAAARPAASAAAQRRALAEVARRAADPAQVRHEWGLAGNACFIVAPRTLTRGLDLDGTAFLHDYAQDQDPDGTLLEAILTAPAVVAHWINAQYLFSGLDPARWGSGSKTAHNPVGAIGVLSGAGGDLRVGLAEQSVHHGGRPRFPLQRLLVVAAADPERVDAVLDRHPDVAALVDGDWVALWAVRPADGRIVRRTAAGWHHVEVPEDVDEQFAVTLPVGASAGPRPGRSAVPDDDNDRLVAVH